ncbi:LPD29 domain-containing protein, partial [Lactonifactor longoviformis]
RRSFYTEYGWEGSRYDGSMTTTEIAKTIRMYCKERYPTWKFSVTSKYFSGGSEILICVMEAPEQIFDLKACRKAYTEHLENEKMGYYGGRGLGMNIEKMLAEDRMRWQLHRISDNYKEYFTEYAFSVLSDVYSFMQSYNYDDSDSMIDYFSCNFCSSIHIGKWDKGFKVVPKTNRIKSKANKPSKVNATTKQESTSETQYTALPDNKTGYTYKITKGEDTRDGSELWVVRIAEKLGREAYKSENIAMQERGGYYSKFKHGFIFRFDPSEILTNRTA